MYRVVREPNDVRLLADVGECALVETRLIAVIWFRLGRLERHDLGVSDQDAGLALRRQSLARGHDVAPVVECVDVGFAESEVLVRVLAVVARDAIEDQRLELRQRVNHDRLIRVRLIKRRELILHVLIAFRLGEGVDL